MINGKKIIIIGAGISGLTIAHKLMNTNNRVIIVEKSDEIGGLVTTYRTKKNGYPIEHSPRVFLENYYNLYKILKEIPLINNNKKTCYDNLTKNLQSYVYDNNSDEKFSINDVAFKIIKTLLLNFSLIEIIKLFYIVCKYLLSGNKRLLEADKIRLQDYIKSNNIKKWVSTMCFIAGEHPTIMPLYKIIIYIEGIIKGDFSTKAMISPYSESWLKHWEHLLLRKNVIILKNTEAKKLNYDKSTNSITSIIVYDKNKNVEYKIDCDIVICSVDINSLISLTKNLNGNILQLGNLSKKANSEQMGVQLYFNNKIKIPNYGNFSILSDWYLIISPQDKLWNNNIYLGNKVKSIWSVCIPDVNLYSKRLKKRAKDCSTKEITNEIMYQIRNTKSLLNNLKKIMPFHSIIWKSWYHNKDGKYTTRQPYFGNTYNTINLRPKNETNIKNMHISGTITNTTYYITYVEGAVESGLEVVNKITGNNYQIYKHNNRIPFLKIIYEIDNILYDLKLPSFFDILLLVLLYFFVTKFFKVKK